MQVELLEWNFWYGAEFWVWPDFWGQPGCGLKFVI